METGCRVLLLQISNSAASLSACSYHFSFLLAGDMEECLKADIANILMSCHAFFLIMLLCNLSKDF